MTSLAVADMVSSVDLAGVASPTILAEVAASAVAEVAPSAVAELASSADFTGFVDSCGMFRM